MVGLAENAKASAMEAVFKFFRRFSVSADHWGSGHLCLMDANTGVIFLLALFGGIDPERGLRTQEYAIEKCRRLRDNLKLGHLTSWESRDPDNKQYGGAIRAKRLLVSFSNLPEAWDHALVSYLAVQMEWLTREDVLRLASLTGDEETVQAVQIVMEK